MTRPGLKTGGAGGSAVWRPQSVRPHRKGQRWRKVLVAAAAILIGVPATLVLIYRYVPPPVTPLMLIRLVEGEGIDKDWTPLSRISPNAGYAVIAAEDNRFCEHRGLDFEAIEDALEEYQGGGDLRGASTITMQTAKNLFLWPGRSWIRKAAEAHFTLFLELLLPKKRILELYLNVAEWGPGIYGIEAASQAYFKKPASKLTRRQASLLAAALPAPRDWSVNPPSSYVAERAQAITRRIGQLGPLLDCARPQG